MVTVFEEFALLRRAVERLPASAAKADVMWALEEVEAALGVKSGALLRRLEEKLRAKQQGDDDGHEFRLKARYESEPGEDDDNGGGTQ